MNEQTPFWSRIKPVLHADKRAVCLLEQQASQKKSPLVKIRTARSDSLQVLRAIATTTLETATQIALQEAKATSAISWWAKRFTNYIFRFLIHTSILPQAIEAMMTEYDSIERTGADRIAALRWKIALRYSQSAPHYDAPLTIQEFKSWSYDAQRDVLFLVENAQSQHASREQRENCEDAIRRLQAGQENVGIDVSIEELIASYNKLTQKERERITPEDVRAMTPTERYKALLLISHEAHLLVGEERALLNELSHIGSPASISALDRIRAYKLEKLLVHAFMKLTPAVQQLFNQISAGEISLLEPPYQQLLFELAKEKVAKYGTTCQRVRVERMTASNYEQIAEILAHYLTIEEKAIVSHAVTRPLGLGQLLPEEIKTLQFQLERLLEGKNDTQAESLQHGLDYLAAAYNTKRKETHGDTLGYILDCIEPLRHQRKAALALIAPNSSSEDLVRHVIRLCRGSNSGQKQVRLALLMTEFLEAHATTDVGHYFGVIHTEPPPVKAKSPILTNNASEQHLGIIQTIEKIAQNQVKHAEVDLHLWIDWYTNSNPYTSESLTEWTKTILRMTEYKTKLDAASIAQDILTELHAVLPPEPKVLKIISAISDTCEQLYHNAVQSYSSLEQKERVADLEGLNGLYMISKKRPALLFFLCRVLPELFKLMMQQLKCPNSCPWHALVRTNESTATESLSLKERKLLLEVTGAETVAEARQILANHSPLERLTLHPAFLYTLDKAVQKKLVSLVQEYGTKEKYETVNDLVAEFVALSPYRKQKALSMRLAEWQALDAEEQERILFIVAHSAGFKDLVDDDADRIVYKYMHLPAELTCGISCTTAAIYHSKTAKQQEEIRLSNAINCSFFDGLSFSSATEELVWQQETDRELEPHWEYEQFLQLQGLEPKKLKKCLALYGTLSLAERSLFTPEDVRRLSPSKRAHMAALAGSSDDPGVIAHLFNRLRLDERQKLLTMGPDELEEKLALMQFLGVDGQADFLRELFNRQSAERRADYYTAQNMQQMQKRCIEREVVRERTKLEVESAAIQHAIRRQSEEEYIPLGYAIHRLEHECSELHTQIEAKQSVAKSLEQALFANGGVKQHKLNALLAAIDTDMQNLTRLKGELEENRSKQTRVAESLQKDLEREDDIEERLHSVQNPPKPRSIPVRTVHAIEQLMDSVLRDVFVALEEALFERVEISTAFEFQKQISFCRERLDQLLSQQKQKLALLRHRAKTKPIDSEQFEIRLAACMIQHLCRVKGGFEERLDLYTKRMHEDMQQRQEQLKALLEQSKQPRLHEAL